MTMPDHAAVETLEQLPLPSCRVLPDTTFVEVNAAYCALLNGREQDILGRKAIDYLSPESAEHLCRVFSEMTPERPSVLSGRQHIGIGGVDKWYIWNDRGLFDDDGTLIGIWAIAWDITEEHGYSTALESLIRLTNDRSIDTQTMLTRILAIGCDYFRTSTGVIARESAGDIITPVYAHAPAGAVAIGTPIAVDSAYASITFEHEGIVAIDDLSQTASVHLPPYANNPLERYISSALYVEGRRYGTIAFSSKTADAQKFNQNNKQFCRFLAQWVTIALERENKITEISRSEELYKQVFDYAPIAMHTIRRNRTITNVNRMWTEKFGYSKDEVVEKDITDFMTSDNAERAAKRIARSFDDTTAAFQRSFRHKDGSVLELEVATFNAKTVMQDEALVVLTDVTDRNRAQRSLSRGNDELRRANEGLKRFNAVAAHDLQEPLRKIGIFGGILEDALIGSSNTGVLESLHVILRSSKRLSKLVKDLLAYSQQTERKYAHERLDLTDILKDVLSDMDLMIKESAARITIGPLPALRGDRVPIERLFHNLINNALTYRRLGQPPEIHIFAETQANGNVELTTRDNGIGVTAETAEKIFEPFARLQPTAFSGTGIGLAMCKSIAEGHGWKIRANQRTDAPGSDFILTIPPGSVLASLKAVTADDGHP